MKRIISLVLVLCFLSGCQKEKTINQELIDLQAQYDELLEDYNQLNKNYTELLDKNEGIIDGWFNAELYNEFEVENDRNYENCNLLGTWKRENKKDSQLITFFANGVGYEILYTNPYVNRTATITPFTYSYEDEILTKTLMQVNGIKV